MPLIICSEQNTFFVYKIDIVASENLSNVVQNYHKQSDMKEEKI